MNGNADEQEKSFIKDVEDAFQKIELSNRETSFQANFPKYLPKISQEKIIEARIEFCRILQGERSTKKRIIQAAGLATYSCIVHTSLDTPYALMVDFALHLASDALVNLPKLVPSKSRDFLG